MKSKTQQKQKHKKTGSKQKRKCEYTTGENISLNIECVELASETQSRTQINRALVFDYAEALRGDSMFPAIDVVTDGKSAWVWDGWHRVLAAKMIGRETVVANVSAGNLHDAVWLAASANRQHGQRRTNADKRRAVMLALRARPNVDVKDVASHCGVSGEMVRQYQAAIDAGKQIEAEAEIGRAEMQEIQGDHADPTETAMGASEAAIFLVLRGIDDVMVRVRALLESSHGKWINGQSVVADLSNAKSAIQQARPHSRCPLCDGAKCKSCRECGWVSKRQFALVTQATKSKATNQTTGAKQ